MRIAWAPSRPHEPSEPIVFRPDAIEILREAGRVFREESPLEELVVTGVVTKVQRNQESDMRIATVGCVIEDKPRSIALELGEADFHIATEAIDKNVGVTFTADIVREGRGLRAQSVRGMRLLADSAS
ncbi:MAG TPA: hypothetical protein VFT98_08510 [Myxococcota bacterium]|nr:hypothetical protein [Myxococcota bacterium]